MNSPDRTRRNYRLAAAVLALSALLDPATAQTSTPERGRAPVRQEREPALPESPRDSRVAVPQGRLDRRDLERAATPTRCPTCNQLLPAPQSGLQFLEQQDALHRTPWPLELDPLAVSPITPSASATFVPAQPAPQPAPSVPPEIAPADQLWEISLTFEGAMNLPSSNEAEAEVYVKVAAHMGVSSFERIVWKELTDQDQSTFSEENSTRMCDVKIVCKVTGDEAVGFSFTFFERDGEYRECARAYHHYSSPRECVSNAGAAQHIWGPTVRYAGPGGDMDFNFAYKLEKRRLR